MVLPRGEREVRRGEEHLRALQGQQPKELGKTNVVADGEPQPPQLRLGRHNLVTRVHAGGLPAHRAVRQRHVEGVELAVARHDGPVRVDHHGGVEGAPSLRVELGEAPAVDVDLVPPGFFHQELRGRPRYGLRLGAIAGLADEVHDLGQGDQTGSLFRRLVDVPGNPLQVVRLVAAGIQLDERDAIPP